MAAPNCDPSHWMCIAAAMVYSCRVTPPNLVIDAAVMVDTAVRRTRLDVLSDPGSPPAQIPLECLKRANTVAIFPCRDGGLGHTPLEIIAAPAYLASLAVSARDEFVQQYRHCLRTQKNLRGG